MGFTPLHYSAIKKRKRSLEFLLAHGANTDLKNNVSDDNDIN